MKLSDNHRKKLIDWVENEEYLPFQQMQFKCLVQLLDQSEQEAWQEVDRLKLQLDDAMNTLQWYVDSGWIDYQNDAGNRAAEAIERIKGEGIQYSFKE